MQIKVGTDICSVNRVAATYAKYGNRFIERILTPAEAAYVLSSPKQTVQRLAARFAAKEAASKVLGTGWNGVGWKEIEVARRPSGEPHLLLHGRAAKLAEKLGLTNFEVSLSHEKEYATAFVVGYTQS
ncbi:MAG TPA: holo-ACP synthase [Planktothrix sp.]|jgi:holo-[acyl-carrier protein] synthase